MIILIIANILLALSLVQLVSSFRIKHLLQHLYNFLYSFSTLYIFSKVKKSRSILKLNIFYCKKENKIKIFKRKY